MQKNKISFFLAFFFISTALASHPGIYSKDSDKELLKRKIEENKWAAQCYNNIKASVDKYVQRHKTDPNWITSRLQMYWNNKYTDVYVNGGVFSHGSGKAPVPTPKFSGARDWASPYENPDIEDIKPYMDDPCGMRLRNKEKPGSPWEYAKLSQTGHIVETTNARIMTLAQNAAFIYWMTGDESYAKFASDIFWTYINGMYYRNNPQTFEDHSNKNIIGLATFEVIHEGITMPLAVTYDYMHDYYIKNGKDISKAEDVFRRWADRIIEGGGGRGNWNINQARFIVYLALAMQDNSAYKDGKGKQYYLDSFLVTTRPNQTALKDFVGLEYDPDQALWPEAPGYAFSVTQMLLEIYSIIWNATGQDILKDYPIIERAYLAYFQFLFPNGYSVGFGDTYHQKPENEALEILYALYTRRNNKEMTANMAGVLNKQMAGNYKRENLNTVAALTTYIDKVRPSETVDYKLATPTYYARAVNMFMQRNGGDEKTALACSLTGTSGGHTHANGMTMELYGLGTILAPDSGRGISYWQKEHGEYYSKFPAHNTVIIDGLSDYPANKPDRESAFRVLVCEPIPEDYNRINAYNSFIYAGFIQPGKTKANQRRLLAIVRTAEKSGYYVDIFRSEKINGQAKFTDYLLHNIGDINSIMDTDFAETTLLSSKNGLQKGYDYFTDVKKISYGGNLNITFAAKLNNQTAIMKMWMAGEKGRIIFTAKAPSGRALMKGSAPKDLQEKALSLVAVRQKGNANFVAIYNPYFKEQGSEIIKIEKLAEIDRFIALKVTCKNNVQYILNSDCDYKRFSVNGIDFEGTYAVVNLNYEGKINYIYLGKGRYIQAADYIIDAKDKMVSANIQIVNSGMSVSCDDNIRITVPGNKSISLSKTYNFEITQ